LEYDATNGAVHVVGAGLYSDNYVSALGANSSGGGGGGGASSLSDLLDVTISSPSGGQVLTYSNGQWINAAIPTPSMTGYATETWVENNFASLTWIGQQGYLTSSSLNGYATQSWVQQQGYLTSSAISDMATKTWVNNQGYLTPSSLSGYATQSWVQNQGYLTSVAFSDLTTHPTTIAGYGITDAKIQNGTITLGSNSITPLTSHQTVSGTFWGQAWSNGGTVNGSLAAGSNGGAIEQFHCIELNNAGSLSGYGGYIDFHYNGSAADYTTRLIESEAGVMLIQAKNSASPYADKVVGLKIGSDVTGESYVQIGNVRLVYDTSNNALKVIKSDGTAANFYATGGVSALGIGSGSGATVENLKVTGTLKFSVNGMDSTIYADNDGYLHIDGNENITMGNDVRMGGYSLYTNGGDVNCGGGKMYASRFYVGTGRYIYLDGTTLKYNDNGTVKTIVLS
jgi:hypothetical protein